MDLWSICNFVSIAQNFQTHWTGNEREKKKFLHMDFEYTAK